MAGLNQARPGNQNALGNPGNLTVSEIDAVTPFHVHHVSADPARDEALYKSANAEHAARWIEAAFAGLRL